MMLPNRAVCPKPDLLHALALPLAGWEWIVNKYAGLPASRLSTLLFHASPNIKGYRQLVRACAASDNLFLRDVEEIYHFPDHFKTNYVDRKSRVVFRSGGFYEGEWFNGLRHGFGYQVFPDGSFYIGDWLNNCANGYGRFIFGTWRDADQEPTTDKIRRLVAEADSDLLLLLKDRDFAKGSEYVGEWKCNMAHGLGYYISRNGGWNYAGQWILDQQDGYGVEFRNEDQLYSGEFQRGFRSGYGVYYTSGGKKVAGSWKNDALTGYGRIQYSPVEDYVGHIEHGMKEGCGRHQVDGDWYQGMFKDDAKDGFGEYHWKDGKGFIGYWKEDQIDGTGRIYLQAQGRSGLDCFVQRGTAISIGYVPEEQSQEPDETVATPDVTSPIDLESPVRDEYQQLGVSVAAPRPQRQTV